MSGKNLTEENKALRPPSPKTLLLPRFSVSLYNPISLSSPRPHSKDATLFIATVLSSGMPPSLSNCDARVSSATLF